MMLRQIIFPEGCQVPKQEFPYHSPCTTGCTFKPGLWFVAGEVHRAENVLIYKYNFRAHIRMYRMYNGSVPACTLNVSLSLSLCCLCVCARLWVCSIERGRERDREGAWVCVFPPVT